LTLLYWKLFGGWRYARLAL